MRATIPTNIEDMRHTNLEISVKNGSGAMSSAAGSEKSGNAVRSTNVLNETDVRCKRIVLAGLRDRSAAKWRQRMPETLKNGRFRKLDGDGDGGPGAVNPREGLAETLLDGSKEVPVETAYGNSESMAGDRSQADHDGF